MKYDLRDSFTRALYTLQETPLGKKKGFSLSRIQMASQHFGTKIMFFISEKKEKKGPMQNHRKFVH